jgi:MFS family permease
MAATTDDTEKVGAAVGVARSDASNDLTEQPKLETKVTFRSIVESYLKRDGDIVVMPAATRDPRDPMNLKMWHKVLGLGCLSFFGALIMSAELILGAALPVFAIQYAGIDPSTFLPFLADTSGGFPAGSNPLLALEFLGGPPIFKIYFLATMPLLVISVANLLLVPLGISIGRRPVILIAGLLAIAGASWAGESTSLDTHIIARSLQAIGAGSVESLIPFIIQDIIPVHQRNTWISVAFAAQGVIIIAIGFSAPFMIVNLSWRWIYHSTAIAASFFLIGIFFFLPETRWYRTRAEMGKSFHHRLATFLAATSSPPSHNARREE